MDTLQSKNAVVRRSVPIQIGYPKEAFVQTVSRLQSKKVTTNTKKRDITPNYINEYIQGSQDFNIFSNRISSGNMTK